jgi:YidC/Oxa1 family membrane protein insertase
MEMEEDKRNLMIFFVVSLLIMAGTPYFFGNGGEEVVRRPTTAGTTIGDSKSDAVSPPKTTKVPLPRAEVKNIRIDSGSLSGVISSRGVRIDNVSLKKYKKDIDGNENVRILGENGDFACTGWLSDDPNVILPDENSCWETNSEVLSEDSPAVFTWDNGNGLLFEKHISVDGNYLLTVVDRVKNYGADATALRSATMIRREFVLSDSSVSFYEGPMGYINGKAEEIPYGDISKKQVVHHKTLGGWFGITDKYWLTAFVPNQKLSYEIICRHVSEEGKNVCRMESSTDTVVIAPSMEMCGTHRLFAGAKEIHTLDMYEKKLDVHHFDLAIDFGWLYILTKPLLYALAYTKDLVGNMGFGILLITLLLKLLLLPLGNKSYRSMGRMSAIQPKIQELRKKYAGDNTALGQAVSEIYKKEQINPLGGCLPLLLQSPILFALYKVLYISIEMRQAPFLWWIRDLSLPDPAALLNLCGLIPIDLPGFLQVGIWPLIMGLSMLLQQKMSPAPADPSQEKMMLIMPVMFTFMFAQLPSGLVIYWTFSNIFGILQQYWIQKSDRKRRSAAGVAGSR